MLVSQVETKLFSLTRRDQIARNFVIKALSNIEDCSLTISESKRAFNQAQNYHLGDEKAELKASIIVNHPNFYQQVLSGGSTGAGESYMQGEWDSPNLSHVVQVVARSLSVLDGLDAKKKVIAYMVDKFSHLLRHNNRTNAAKNISAHYDLGNDFYQLFLDSEMLYSSGIYNAGDDLAQAQLNKMQRLCEQLALTADDHLLEIGTGWGGMAIYAAKHYGCKVTTTTISQQQYELAKQRVAAEGLEGQITLLKQDYRDLEGQYDKLVSIEMIEAVGERYLPGYLQKCQSLLKPGGLMALQVITMADQRHQSYSNSVDFIQKYIFPGGYLPSLTQLHQLCTQHTDFIARNCRDIGLDYARTLNDWQSNFKHKLPEVAKLGYPESFVRMWNFYLSYCEGGFLERRISTVQLLLARPAF